MTDPKDEHDLVINASYLQYREFVTSFIWADLRTEITKWIDQAHIEIESTRDMAQIYHMQGVIEACRRFIVLPQEILESFEILQRRIREDDEDGSGL